MNEKVKDIIQKYITFINITSTNEYVFRCPICGDSKKSYKGHFYVSPEYKFICFKCNTKGLDVRKLLLNMFNLSGSDKIEIIKDMQIYRTEPLETKILPNFDYYEYKQNFERAINTKRNSFERKIITEIFIPYLKKRQVGAEEVVRELINEHKILFHFKEDPIKIESYIPTTLLNRIYFYLDEGVYIQRQINKDIDGIYDGKKRNYGKYVFYKPKLHEGVIPGFLLNNFSLNEPSTTDKTLFLVEGVFDAIKIFSMNKEKISQLQVYTLNGKFVNEKVKDIIIKIYPKGIIYFPDTDLTEKEISKNLDTLKSFYSGTILIGLLKGMKDLGDIKDVSDLKNISVRSVAEYNIYKKFNML